MFNTEEYKLFIKSNCLLCKKYKGSSEDNCGTNKKIEISQYLEGVAAEAVFPLKDLKEIPSIIKYSCKKLEGKGDSRLLVKANVDPVKKIESASQIKMF